MMIGVIKFTLISNSKFKQLGEQVTQKQKQTHASLVKGVHLSQRYKNYYRHNREEYVEMLEGAFGKKSSVGLSVSELILLLDYMNMKSVKLPTYAPKRATPAQVWKIMQVWDAKARDKSDTALEKFVFRVAKTTLNDMTYEGAKKVLIALGKFK
jgi:hypothetical protein